MRSRRTTVVLPEELRDCFKLESVGGKVRGTRLHKVHDCDWAGRVIVADNSAEMRDRFIRLPPCDVVECGNGPRTENAPWPSSWTSLEDLTQSRWYEYPPVRPCRSRSQSGCTT